MLLSRLDNHGNTWLFKITEKGFPMLFPNKRYYDLEMGGVEVNNISFVNNPFTIVGSRRLENEI